DGDIDLLVHRWPLLECAGHGREVAPARQAQPPTVMQLLTLHKVLIGASIAMSVLFALWAGWSWSVRGSTGHLAAALLALVAAAAPAAATAEAGSDEYQGSDPVAGAGTIKGTVTYTGKETDTKVTITKDDATCCAACKAKEKMAGSLVVTDGKLANVVIWLPE